MANSTREAFNTLLADLSASIFDDRAALKAAYVPDQITSVRACLYDKSKPRGGGGCWMREVPIAASGNLADRDAYLTARIADEVEANFYFLQTLDGSDPLDPPLVHSGGVDFDDGWEGGWGDNPLPVDDGWYTFSNNGKRLWEIDEPIVSGKMFGAGGAGYGSDRAGLLRAAAAFYVLQASIFWPKGYYQIADGEDAIVLKQSDDAPKQSWYGDGTAVFARNDSVKNFFEIQGAEFSAHLFGFATDGGLWGIYAAHTTEVHTAGWHSLRCKAIFGMGGIALGFAWGTGMHDIEVSGGNGPGIAIHFATFSCIRNLICGSFGNATSGGRFSGPVLIDTCAGQPFNGSAQGSGFVFGIHDDYGDTAQATGTATITLPSDCPYATREPVGMNIDVIPVGGTVDDTVTRRIIDYVASTKIATVGMTDRIPDEDWPAGDWGVVLGTHPNFVVYDPVPVMRNSSGIAGGSVNSPNIRMLNCLSEDFAESAIRCIGDYGFTLVLDSFQAVAGADHYCPIYLGRNGSLLKWDVGLIVGGDHAGEVVPGVHPRIVCADDLGGRVFLGGVFDSDAAEQLSQYLPLSTGTLADADLLYDLD